MRINGFFLHGADAVEGVIGVACVAFEFILVVDDSELLNEDASLEAGLVSSMAVACSSL